MLRLLGFAASLAALAPGSALAQKKLVVQPGMMTLYELPNYNGDSVEIVRGRTSLTLDWPVRSIAIAPGDNWQLCEKKTYKGNCATLSASVADTAVAGTISVVASARPAK